MNSPPSDPPPVPLIDPPPVPLIDPPPVPLPIPLPSPFRSPFRPPSKGGDQRMLRFLFHGGDQRMLRFLFHGEAKGCFAFCSMGKPKDASLFVPWGSQRMLRFYCTGMRGGSTMYRIAEQTAVIVQLMITSKSDFCFAVIGEPGRVLLLRYR